MRAHVVWLVSLGLGVAVPALGMPSSPTAEELEFFEKRVRPVLIEHCYSCHSADAERVRAGLLLDTRAGMLDGGDMGPALVPGDPDASLFIIAIRHSDPDLRMPPKGEKLGSQQIADLEDWIRMGAPDPRVANGPVAATGADAWAAGEHWAFRPVIKPAVPEVESSARAQNPIDSFVLAELEARGMRPSAQADGHTWLRRVTYDVTGLPPTPDEMETFLEDRSPEARARVVDRLLSSPRYGERWGRYWLDVARYADTKGYVFQEERRFPFAHTYRDYVIEAFNEDKPYDRFVLEQLAADQLGLDDDNGALAAMGFLTLGRRFLNNPHDIIDDRIDVVFRGLQGLTVSCARCHDHKFEPIPTRDYYALYGVFASSEEPAEKPVLRRLIDPEDHTRFVEEQRRLQSALDERTDEEISLYRKQVVERRADYEQAAREALANDPPDDTIEKLAAERNLVVQVLRRVIDSIPSDPAASDESSVDPFELSSDDVRSWARVQIQEATAKLRNQLAELEIQHPGAPVRAMVLVDKAEPVDPVVFVRGNPGNRGPEVPRQLPGILAGDSPQPFTIGSGRLELARAIASPDNPLTARVIVNRIWLGHFGQGLVRTPSDFGVRTEAPPHRALLDYLASWVVENGWSLKQLHRLILLSNTYGQATDDNPEYAAQDPGNDLLWKMNRRRLDFEALRDTLLVAGGHLDLTMGGRAVDIASNDPAPRRTVYGFIDRQNLPGLFRTFDFANPDVTSPQRFATTVPQQALYLMNNPFPIRQARRLVERPELTSVSDAAARVRRLYRLLFQRDPDAEELRLARAFLESQSHETAVVVPGPAWQYGFGSYDPGQGRVTTFTGFDHFESNRWQPGTEYPAPEFGHAALHASGGHPGPDGSLSVIRRWVAPLDGSIAIEGDLEHKNDQGDGVRALIVHGVDGEIGRWEVFNSATRTSVDRVRVKAGDVVDFVTDPLETASYDSFNWAPRIRFLDVDPMEALQTAWDANADFAGPGTSSPAPLDPWERYAHVLLQSNELVFLD
jgi:hypothetical protein